VADATVPPEPALDVADDCELAGLPDDVQPARRAARPMPMTARELVAVLFMISKTLPAPVWLKANLPSRRRPYPKIITITLNDSENFAHPPQTRTPSSPP